jgi:CheY-like chemotaxis protein
MKTPAPATPHILLVDDNADGLLVRRSLLQEAGCTVEIAHNGIEGLKLFSPGKFDLVVTDFRMPGMDGVQFIRHVRAEDPRPAIILLSGFVEPLGLNEENTGADIVIAKTASEAAHLVRAVKRLVNRPIRKPPASQRTLRSRAGVITAGR